MEWRPHRKQAEFLSLPFSIKEALYGGGAGSAKTETLLMYPLVHRLHENPRFKQVFMRRTLADLRKEVVPRAKNIYRRFGAQFNGTHMYFEFPSGAMIFLGHCEHEDDVHNYDSMEISLFTPDELTSFTEFIYTYIAFERNRAPKGSGLPSIVRAAGMPGDIGHTWVKKRFIEPYPKGGKVLIGRGENLRIYIHATQADNPHIDPSYAKSLDALPEAERQAKKFGSWDAYLGQVFEEFRDRKYSDEPENALHVIEPFDIPSWWPKVVGIDWGFAPPAMTWVGYGAVSPERKLYIYREQSWQKTKIEEWCAEAKFFIDQEQPRAIIMCKSAGQDRGQEHTILSQVSNALGHNVELANATAGSRIAGKMLLHEYFRWRPKYQAPKPEIPFNQEQANWILRNRSFKEYESYLSQFNEPEPELGLPKLQIFKTCPLVINAIKACSYDKTNPQDVAEFPGDDPYDALRYIVDRADRYFDDSSDEFARIKRQEELVNQLKTTQDYTAFYRNARRNDVEDIVKPIKRYHVH